MGGNEIMVSIACATYNHESYIADAIESFLRQRTTFNIEILIHDDASTDSTPGIIREHERKYPGLIRPIYQTVNQYSKGVKVGLFNAERAVGKYVALCEGDDFWLDPLKLQKQVEYMEKCPECSLCVHAANIVTPDTKKRISIVRPSLRNKTFSIEETIEGGGGLFATNTILFPSVFIKDLPEFIKRAPIGDYPLAIYLALRGSVYYIDEIMSAYRHGVRGSWSDMEFSNIDKKNKHFDKIDVMLDEINQHTNYRYDDVFKRTKERNQFNLLLGRRKFNEAKKGELRLFYAELGFKQKIVIFLKQYFPSIFNLLVLVKGKLL